MGQKPEPERAEDRASDSGSVSEQDSRDQSVEQVRDSARRLAIVAEAIANAPKESGKTFDLTESGFVGEDLLDFSGKERKTEDHPWGSPRDKANSARLEKDPELKRDYEEAARDLRVDIEKDFVHVYLPGDEAFDLTFSQDEVDGLNRLMVDTGSGGILAASGGSDGFSASEIKEAIREQTQTELIRYLSGNGE